MNDTAPAILRSRAGVPVPLVAVRADVLVNDVFTRVTFEQRYANREQHAIEAIYTFPVPSDAALYRLEVRLGDRLLVAASMENGRAEQKYEEAIEQRDAAVLLQQPEPGLYTLNFANLPPGEEAAIRVVYAVAHRWIGDALRVRIPTVIGARYGSSPLESHQVPVTDFRAEHAFDFALRIRGALADVPFTCPSHELSARPCEDGMVLALPEAASFLDRDLVLCFTRPESFSGDVALVAAATSPATADAAEDHADGAAYEASGAFSREPKPEVPSGGFTTSFTYERTGTVRTSAPDAADVVLVGFTPRYPGRRDAVPRSVKLLIDCSGSMQGESIEQARRAIGAILDGLGADDVFNIIRFGSHVDSLFAGQVRASAGNLEIAKRAMRRMEADLGGTEIEDGLIAAWRSVGPKPSHLEEILLITDGHVGDWQSIVRRAGAENQRVFSVGVGMAPTEGFLAQLAKETGGAAECVMPGEDMPALIERQFHRIRQPRVGGLSATWPAEPRRLAGFSGPTTFDGDTLLLSAWFGERIPEGGVIVEVTWEDGASSTHEVPLRHVSGVDARVSAALAAKQRIGETHDKAEALALALQYGLPSSHTSLYLTAPLAAGKGSDMPALRKVPQMHAHGWGGIGRAATPRADRREGLWTSRAMGPSSAGRGDDVVFGEAFSNLEIPTFLERVEEAPPRRKGKRTYGGERDWSQAALVVVQTKQAADARWLGDFIRLDASSGKDPTEALTSRLAELALPAEVVQELLAMAVKQERMTHARLGMLLADFLRELFRACGQPVPAALRNGSWRTRGRRMRKLIRKPLTETAPATAEEEAMRP
jgi:Ca-activated chloride channel family protein